MADETKTNATPEAPGGPPAPEQTEQAVIPGMDFTSSGNDWHPCRYAVRVLCR